MEVIAGIGFAIETSQIAAGAAELDNLTAAAGRAEAAERALATTGSQAVQAITATTAARAAGRAEVTAAAEAERKSNFDSLAYLDSYRQAVAQNTAFDRQRAAEQRAYWAQYAEAVRENQRLDSEAAAAKRTAAQAASAAAAQQVAAEREIQQAAAASAAAQEQYRRRATASLGNVGQQFQDVIVQAQAGTAASVIFAQQGPQIAGAFGPVGAVVGAVAAAVVVLGAAVYRLSGGTDTAKDAQNSFSDAQQRSKDALQATADSVGNLTEKYGPLADKMREVAGIKVAQAVAANLATIEDQDAQAAALFKSLHDEQLMQLFQQQEGVADPGAGAPVRSAAQQLRLDIYLQGNRLQEGQDPADVVAAIRKLIQDNPEAAKQYQGNPGRPGYNPLVDQITALASARLKAQQDNKDLEDPGATARLAQWKAELQGLIAAGDEANKALGAAAKADFERREKDTTSAKQAVEQIGTASVSSFSSAAQTVDEKITAINRKLEEQLATIKEAQKNPELTADQRDKLDAAGSTFEQSAQLAIRNAREEAARKAETAAKSAQAELDRKAKAADRVDDQVAGLQGEADALQQSTDLYKGRGATLTAAQQAEVRFQQQVAQTGAAVDAQNKINQDDLSTTDARRQKIIDLTATVANAKVENQAYAASYGDIRDAANDAVQQAQRTAQGLVRGNTDPADQELKVEQALHDLRTTGAITATEEEKALAEARYATTDATRRQQDAEAQRDRTASGGVRRALLQQSRYDVSDATQDFTSSTVSATNSFFQRMATEGNLTFKTLGAGFKELGRSILADATRIGLQLAETQLFGILLKTAAGIGGAYLGGGGTGADAANGGGFQAGGALQAGTLHGGGEVGLDGVPRFVSAAAFRSAPRYHDGYGLAPDERAAILQVGEKVIPRGRSVTGAVQNFNVQAPLSIDARGADRTAVPMMQQALREAQRRLVPQIMDAMRRDPQFRQSMRR